MSHHHSCILSSIFRLHAPRYHPNINMWLFAHFHINCVPTMARVTSQFVSVLLREHFGPIPEKVGGVVHASAPVTLRQVMMKSMAAGVSPRDVKKAMRILMQHDVLTVCKNPHGLLEYELSLKRVQSLLRYPTYMLLAGKLWVSH